MSKLYLTFALCAIVAFAEGQEVIRLGSKQAPVKETYMQAYKMCLNMGMILVTPDSMKKLRALQAHLEQEEVPFSWIALTNQFPMNNWTWLTTGRNLTDAIWHPDQPNNESNNEHCVEMVFRMHKVRMNDISCDKKNYVFCETASAEAVQVAKHRLDEATGHNRH